MQLNLDQLDFVEKEDEWKKLTLPKGHKQIVQAMVETHSSGSHNSADDDIDKIEMDLVRGKGKHQCLTETQRPGRNRQSLTVLRAIQAKDVLSCYTESQGLARPPLLVSKTYLHAWIIDYSR